jgi:hypothetical protein
MLSVIKATGVIKARIKVAPIWGTSRIAWVLMCRALVYTGLERGSLWDELMRGHLRLSGVDIDVEFVQTMPTGSESRLMSVCHKRFVSVGLGFNVERE